MIRKGWQDMKQVTASDIDIPGEIVFTDKTLAPIWEKIQASERLSFEDGLHLFDTPDFVAIGNMANYVKRRWSGDNVYFVTNVHVNPTNICVLTCTFCDFAKKDITTPGAYEMNMEQILKLITNEISEVHIVGGHHPTWTFEHYEDMVRTIHQQYPHTNIKAFTAAEIDFFWRRWKVPPEEALTRLKAAGLQSMPGGGAEVFSDRMNKITYPGKAKSQRWLEIHRLAHSLGIPTNATLLYGHLETYEERVRHLLMLRELQDETGGFLTFIPLEYQLGDTQLVSRHASPIDDLKTISASRLLLDNFPHIKAYWVMIGEETASIALNFGADDLDGTIGEERIAHAAKAASPLGLARERMVRLIRDAGKIPVERNALYGVVEVYDN
jgi:aminodeoxyfutalosine synthase